MMCVLPKVTFFESAENLAIMMHVLPSITCAYVATFFQPTFQVDIITRDAPKNPIAYPLATRYNRT